MGLDGHFPWADWSREVEWSRGNSGGRCDVESGDEGEWVDGSRDGEWE